MKKPPIHKIEKLNFLSSEKFFLDNNTAVSAFFNNDISALRIDFVFPAGKSWQNKAFLASLTNAMLREGSIKNPDPASIEEKLDYYGIFIEQRVETYWSVYSIYTPLMYLDKALPLIKEIIFEPNLTDDSLNFLKENSRSSIKKNLEKAAFLARANAMELLWGENHPMGYFPKPEKLDNISIEDIKDFYSRHYQNANFSIYISGNYPKNIISSLNELFGKHNTNNITISDKVYNLSNKHEVRNINLNNQVQTAINWTKKCIGPRDADFNKLKITNTILGGYFGSRLMLNIREDKAYTYGISSLLRASTISNSINIETEVGTEYYEDTIKQIDFELLKLKNDLISESELNIVKNYMSGELLSSFDGVFNHASILKYLDEIKLDFTYFSDYLETIKNITPEEIRNTASKYLDTKSFHKVSVG